MEIFVLVALALALGLFLDAVVGRGAGDFLPHLGLEPEAGGRERLSPAAALAGPGALLLLGLGLALLPGHAWAGGLLAAGGLALGRWGWRRPEQGR